MLHAVRKGEDMRSTNETTHRRLAGELARLFQVDETAIHQLMDRPHRPLPRTTESDAGLSSPVYRMELEAWMTAELREPTFKSGRHGQATISQARDQLRSWHDVRQFRGRIPTEYFLG